MEIKLKKVRCCGTCRYFMYGNGYLSMLDGVPMHCRHPQFLKETYRREYYEKVRGFLNKEPAFVLFGRYTLPEDTSYYTDAAVKVEPFMYCENWEGDESNIQIPVN